MKNTLNGNGLKREIGLFSATILVVANTVGTGIFTTSGFIMSELGNPRALLFCWLCGGVFALCGALCYGELGARFPRAGGEYVFLKESFGKPVAFLSGWISLIVGFSAPIAAASIAFGTYLFQAFSIPAYNLLSLSIFGYTVIKISSLSLVAIVVIILFSIVHYHSLHMGSRVQNALTILKITLVISFIVAGFFLGKGSIGHFFETTIIETLPAEKFAVSLIFVSFAYSGWNAAAYLGGEITNPQRNIPLSLFIGTFIVIFLYLLLNAVYIYAMPPKDMGGVLEIGAKSAIFLFGENISRVFSGAISIGLLSVISAMIMTGPRIYYAMSKDRIFFNVFSRLDTAHKTPAYSIFLQAAIAVIMVVSASFETLLLYIGFTLSLFATLTVIGLMKIRTRGLESGIIYKTFGYPVTPLIFIAGNLWIIFFSIKSRPVTALLGIGTIGLGIIVYLFFAVKQKHDKVLAS
ncbi:MAG: amino acid permease [Proteobacteria bacterium]|nr:amino acid permease [Pseudomonadota bacterium]